MYPRSGFSRNRKWCRQTGSRQSTPLSTIRTRYGNSVSTPGATRTGKSKQNSLQKGSRYGNSVSTPHRRYGHRLRTPFLRTSFPRLLVFVSGEHPPKPPFWKTTLLSTHDKAGGAGKRGSSTSGLLQGRGMYQPNAKGASEKAHFKNAPKSLKIAKSRERGNRALTIVTISQGNFRLEAPKCLQKSCS